MPLKRLYVTEKLTAGAQLRLGGQAERYLGRVLRLRAGDTVHVFNGHDGEWSATIDRFARERVTLLVQDAVENAAESRLEIHLAQGISRGERMDFVVQKATELGVRRITPVLTDYGVVRLDGKRAEKRQLHWQRVAESACEQSGRTSPPHIDAPQPLNDWLGTPRVSGFTDLILMPAAGRSLTSVEAPQSALCLLIGPEGGFSEREYDDAGLAGFAPGTLGPRILRTETAAIAALATAQGLWGDF